jgi:hypothetical protein
VIARCNGAGGAVTPTGPDAVKAARQTADHNPAAHIPASDFAFVHHRQAALTLLADCPNLPHKAAGFLGHLCVAPTLSERQRNWLALLLDQAGLPHLAERGENG